MFGKAGKVTMDVMHGGGGGSVRSGAMEDVPRVRLDEAGTTSVR